MPGYGDTKTVATEHCSQIIDTTGNTPGQNLTVGQCCFEEDIAELWYAVSLSGGRTGWFEYFQ
jgi:hypothetical protein